MDHLSAAARAAWLTDPVFVTLAKSLYGDDVDLSDIQQDVFGKADPDVTDEHVKTPFWRKKKKTDPDAMVEDPAQVGKSLAESVANGELTNVQAYEVAKAWGQSVAAATTGALAGAYVASHHMHKNQIKQHIQSKHSGSYHKCNSCSLQRQSKVAKDWAEFDSKRASTNPRPFDRRSKIESGLAGAAVAGLALNSAGRKVLVRSAQKAEVSRFMHEVQGHLVGVAEDEKRIEGLKSHPGLSRLNDIGPASLAVGSGLAAGVDHERQRGEDKQFARFKERVKTKKSYDEDEHEVTWEGEFSKVDDDKRQVFGWASVTEIDGKPVVDLQGDYIHPTEMERAAYDYVLKSRKGGDMHSRVDENGKLISKADQPLHVSDMIESMVFTPEKVAKLGLPEGSLPTGWWVGFKVNDEPTWDLVKSGERKGFSIHGLGARMEKRLEEIDPEASIVGKAYAVSANTEEFKANLETIAEVTGEEFYKHIAHGINAPQSTMQNTRTAVGAGIGGAVGSNIGALAGVATHRGGEAPRVGQAAGGLVGATVGAALGHHSGRPPRPPIVEQHLGPRMETASKAVSTANRSGSVAHRQDYYSKEAMQQATAALAPQVAQHIQNMQAQQWQQAQMEQQMLQQQATGGQPAVNPQQQNWQTLQQGQQLGAPMGPYDSADPSNSGVTPNQQSHKSGAVSL